jgi:hypothetical protein
LHDTGLTSYCFRVREHISIRLRRSDLKAELACRAKPNVKAWLNNLIERELSAPANDWREILKGQRPVVSNEIFDQCLKPE